MTTTLHPASDRSNTGSTTTHNNDVIRFGLSIHIAPGIGTRDLESTASPATLRTPGGRLEGLLEGDSFTEMADPDLQASSSLGSSKHVMARILDNQTNVKQPGKGDGCRHMPWF